MKPDRESLAIVASAKARPEPIAPESAVSAEGPRYRSEQKGTMVVSTIVRRSGSIVTSRVRLGSPTTAVDQDELASLFDCAYLRSGRRPRRTTSDAIRVADLFSGCGLMSEGAATACHRLGLAFTPVLAIDLN